MIPKCPKLKSSMVALVVLVALACICKARNHSAVAKARTLNLPTFVRFHYQGPHEVLGVGRNASPQEARAQFLSRFTQLASGDQTRADTITRLQLLCFAFNLAMLNSIRAAQQQQPSSPAAQQPSSPTAQH